MAVSARGLFRATGKTSRPVAVQIASDLAGAYEKAEHLERAADDFYPTPPEPTRALLAAELPFLSRFDTIWEPACGDGAMAREIESVGFRCIKSDLIDRGCGGAVRDYFAFREPPCRAQITNPPYDKVNARDGGGAWVWHGMDALHLDYMALLLNWSWPGAAGLNGLWAKHPPARVYLMRWKIDFTGQGAPPMLNGWFVWDRQHCDATQLLMLDKGDARQTEMFKAVA